MIKLSRIKGVRHALASLALGLAAFASPAGAVPQIIEGTWIDGVSKQCTSTLACNAPFTAVPPGKTLIARNIACRIQIPSQNSPLSIGLTGNNKTVSLNFGPVILLGSATKYYVVQAEIFDPFKAGAIPSVSYSSTASASSTRVNCTLSGELKP